MMEENNVELWQHALPDPAIDGHKYHRGHALIFAAMELTGATRLAATACSRIGAGLTSVFAPNNADIYRTTLPADMMVVSHKDNIPGKVTTLLAGPGGIMEDDLDLMNANPWGASLILDANAIPIFEIEKDINPFEHDTILTPHQGEFERCFPTLRGSRKECVLNAAAMSGAVVVLKGKNTLIASPSGRLVENTNASKWLAKAGSGDVLSGIITGLVAQGMPAFDAACAGVWIHGEAGKRIGVGLVAGDIEAELKSILKTLIGD